MESGVELNQIGSTGRYIGICPFHEDKNTLFNVDSVQQQFHCFGCGAHGDVYTFLMKYKNIMFKDALKELAIRVGESLVGQRPKGKKEYEKEQCYKFMLRAVEYYHNTLFDKFIGMEILDYLEKNNITRKMCVKHKIGYAPTPEKYGYKYLYNKLNSSQQMIALKVGLIARSNGKVYDTFRNRIIIPIKHKTGQYVGLTSKNTGNEGPKYLVSKESMIFKKDQQNVKFSEKLAYILSCHE